jgi:hypothetical protein
VTYLLVLPLEHRPPAKLVDRVMLCSAHEPRCRLVGHTRHRPLLERRNQRILRQLLGEPDIADDPCQGADQPRGVDPPDCLDRAMGSSLGVRR